MLMASSQLLSSQLIARCYNHSFFLLFSVNSAPNCYLVASDDGLHGQVIVNQFVIDAAACERLALSSADRER